VLLAFSCFWGRRCILSAASVPPMELDHRSCGGCSLV